MQNLTDIEISGVSGARAQPITDPGREPIVLIVCPPPPEVLDGGLLPES